ncbi:MAG: UbiA-like polyprenyltransferase [Algisphaera sp.]
MTAHPAPTPLLPQLAALGRDIKLSHTVFALPFAVLGAVLAATYRGVGLSMGEIILVLACMVLARTFAMTFNRLADAALDAQNPRTQNRAVASGRVSRQVALATLGTTALGFIAASGGFALFYANTWPLFCSPAVLALLAVYSLTKRFTWACHLALGLALAISPVAAALAICPAYLSQPTPWLIALMVALWVAGFDVIYALQDVAVDRAQGLFSMPSRLGENNALWISRALHLLSMAALVAAGVASLPLNQTFGIATAATAALLLFEHALVWRSKRNHLNMAFFTVNGIISLLLGAAGCWDAWHFSR